METYFAGLDPVIGTADLASWLGTPVSTLRYWRHLGEGPKSFRLGRRVVYRRSDVVAWLDDQSAVAG